MNKDKNKLSFFERYLTKEIGIEFKSSLYFFAMLFFYCIYKLTHGSFTADILHMAEMILLCYLIAYMQVYIFGNFDESENLRIGEIAGAVVCTSIYAILSHVLGWFDKSLAWTIGYAFYVIFVYICMFLIYKIKRRIDDRVLNEELEIFQSREEKVSDTDE